MPLFHKKKKSAAQETVSEQQIQKFLRTPDYDTIRPGDYTIYPKLRQENLIPILDAQLNAICSKGSSTDAAALLDSLIFAAAREAFPDLNKQRLQHTDALRRLIARRRADRQDFSRLAEARRQELAALEQSYAKTCRLLSITNREERSV